MMILDWISLTVFTVLLGWFYLTGRRLRLYLIGCGAITLFVALAGVRFDWNPGWEQWLIALMGIVLASSGLLTIRLMSMRSVSLDLLYRVAHEDEGSWKKTYWEAVKKRLADIIRYRLGARVNGRLRLTGFGRFVANFIEVCYMVMGSKG